MNSDAEDLSLRLAAFRHLNDLKRSFGASLRHEILRPGFEYDGRRVYLMGPQGIFTPAGFDVPLSITTAPLKRGKERPYDDEFGTDGFLRYRYRGSDPGHRDNVGLRRARSERRPLIYFHGTVTPRYVPVFPVFVVADEPTALTFTMQVAEADLNAISTEMVADPLAHDPALLRRYHTVEVQKRLHQQLFRDRVLDAYRARCSVCLLGHDELLDAAHIRPDAEGGQPVIPNGLALCKLHHAAYDANLLGIRPGLQVEVSQIVLEEEDGPMLRHGLQGIHGRDLHVPSRKNQRPDKDSIEWRYERFRRAQ